MCGLLSYINIVRNVNIFELYTEHMLKVSSAYYIYGKVGFLTPEGEEIIKSFDELEYPYFYSLNPIKAPDKIVDIKKVKLQVLVPDTPDGKKEMEMYKISTLSPYYIRDLRVGATLSVEDDVTFLERRLGADKIIEWEKPETYAIIDLETDASGKPFLYGYIPVKNGVEGEYLGFTTPESLIHQCEKDKVACVIGYNSYNYDFKFFESYEKNTYWKKMTKLDAMLIYSKFRQKPFRSLDYIAKEEGFGGKIKIDRSIWRNKKIEITDDMIEYNYQDCHLLFQIIEKYDLIGLVYILSRECGTSPTLMYQSNYWAGYVMKHRDKYGVYLLGKQEKREKEEYEGAFVYAGKRGVLKNVAVFDYTSLYPNVVLNTDYPNGVYRFMRETMKDFVNLKTLFRENYKETKDKKSYLASEAFKILANGSYGLFGNVYWAYYDSGVAEHITSTGKFQIHKAMTIMKRDGYNVVLGDTDSSFVENISYEEASRYVEKLNKELYPYPIKLEKYFTRLIISGDDEEVKKKKYFGITNNKEILITGMETLRGDRCKYIKDWQRYMINTILYSPEDKIYENAKRVYDTAIKRIVRHSAPIEDLGITKTIDTTKEYKANVQQMRAFEKMKKEGKALGRVPFVTYWIGKNGEVLIEEELWKGINWDYYLENQIKPPLDRLLESIKPEKITLDLFTT